MRKTLLLALVLFGCSKAETPPPDTASATKAPPPPANLTAAALAGTWKGTTMPETGDSVVNRWTVVSINDSTQKWVLDGSKDSVSFSRKFDADSMIATSMPYTNPQAPKGPKVVFHSVGRMKDGKLVGTATVTLATKPDSVVQRTRWEASRAP
jgi:hypothetical protein